MTKWFDTNYHYMVPEFVARQALRAVLDSSRSTNSAKRRRWAIDTRPVLLGPVTFLKLGKSKDAALDPLALLRRTAAGLCRGAAPPCRRRRRLGADRRAVPGARSRRRDARGAAPGLCARWPQRCRAEDHADDLFRRARRQSATRRWRCRSPACMSIWCARRSSSTRCWRRRRADLVLSLGVIDGRNIWRADLPALLDRLEPVVAKRGADRVQIAPSCSLLHVPVDLELETELDAELKSWLAFAVQKLDELAALARRWPQGRDAVGRRCWRHRPQAAAARNASPKVHDAAVAARMAGRDAGDGPAQQRLRRRAHESQQRALQPAGCSRPPPSARSRRPPRCARRARPTPRAS